MHLRAARGRCRRHPGAHRRTAPGQPSGGERDDEAARSRGADHRPTAASRSPPTGRRLAEQVVRRHRLAERFLTDVLKLSWAEAHHEAGRWEHVISDSVELAMNELLGDPTTCPHGNPIPGSDYQAPDSAPLSLSRGGRRVHGSSDHRGTRVRARPARVPRGVGHPAGQLGSVTAASPDGTLTVEIDGRHVGVGSFASERILVTS